MAPKSAELKQRAGLRGVLCNMEHISRPGCIPLQAVKESVRIADEGDKNNGRATDLLSEERMRNDVFCPTERVRCETRHS